MLTDVSEAFRGLRGLARILWKLMQFGAALGWAIVLLMLYWLFRGK